MYKKCPNNTVQCAKDPLSFVVLGGCVGAQSAEKDDAASQEGSSGIVEELRAIICLKTATELCVSVSYERDNMLMNFRFMVQRKGPTIMYKIINYHKIIFITTNTQNWGGPDITMQEFKCCESTRNRTSKWQPSVFA
jgi:hypothetical protein